MKTIGGLVAKSLGQGTAGRIAASLIVESTDKYLSQTFGADITESAKTISYKNDSIHIGCSDSIIAGEIFFRRKELIDYLHNDYPDLVVKRIVFRDIHQSTINS